MKKFSKLKKKKRSLFNIQKYAKLVKCYLQLYIYAQVAKKILNC